MNLSELITAAEGGDRAAKDRLFAALYDDLRRLARRELNRRGGAQDVSATTLVHEFYASLAEREGLSFPDRARFLAYASRAMRGFIIDASRDRHALKRGGAFHITHLDTHAADAQPDPSGLQRVSEAIDELATLEPRLAEVVDLKYFCGFSFAEIAAMTNLSERTVQRDWEKARLLLFDALKDAGV
jgi:RNA polymerase sigma factor (TIGR02999 family)